MSPIFLLGRRVPKPFPLFEVYPFPRLRDILPIWLSLSCFRPTERPVKEILISNHDVPDIAAKLLALVIPIEVLTEHNLAPLRAEKSYKYIV